MSNHHLVRAEDALVWGRQWTVRGQINNNNMYSTQSTWGCSDNSDEGLLLTAQDHRYEAGWSLSRKQDFSGRPFLMKGCTQTLWPLCEPGVWCRESSWGSRNQENQEEILCRLTKGYLAPPLRATLKQQPTATTLFFQAQKRRGTVEILCGVRSKHLANNMQKCLSPLPKISHPNHFLLLGSTIPG